MVTARFVSNVLSFYEVQRSKKWWPIGLALDAARDVVVLYMIITSSHAYRQSGVELEHGKLLDKPTE